MDIPISATATTAISTAFSKENEPEFWILDFRFWITGQSKIKNPKSKIR